MAPKRKAADVDALIRALATNVASKKAKVVKAPGGPKAMMARKTATTPAAGPPKLKKAKTPDWTSKSKLAVGLGWSQDKPKGEWAKKAADKWGYVSCRLWLM
jgi:hypothetical protein